MIENCVSLSPRVEEPNSEVKKLINVRIWTTFVSEQRSRLLCKCFVSQLWLRWLSWVYNSLSALPLLTAAPWTFTLLESQCVSTPWTVILSLFLIASKQIFFKVYNNFWYKPFPNSLELTFTKKCLKYFFLFFLNSRYLLNDRRIYIYIYIFLSWKRNLRVALDYSHQICIYIHKLN